MVTNSAQTAIGAASVGLLRLLESLGIEPDMVAGHSYGELVALHAAGSIAVEGLAELSDERGRLMTEALGDDPGAMAAIGAGPAEVARLIEGLRDVVLVNENGPRQSVIAGAAGGVSEAVDRANAAGFKARLLAVAGAFHTSRMKPVAGRLEGLASARIGSSPRIPVYANLDARPHPLDLPAIARRLGRHVAAPVRFASMVEAMHDDGARVFVEVGPGSVLSPMVGSILGDRPHRSVSCDSPGRPGIASLLHSLARLVVAGVPARLDRLTRGRSTRSIDPDHLPLGDGSAPASPSTWLVNGSRARPIGQPEPRRLGQGPALPYPGPGARPSAPMMANGSSPGHHANGAPRNGKPMKPQPISPTSSPPPVPADDLVILAFQETMRTFLEVQKSTMLAYLAGRPVGTTPGVIPPPTPLPGPIADRIASRQAPAPVRLPASTPPPEPAPEPVQFAESRPNPAPSEPSGGREALAARLVEIVRDRTGYPSEMLGLDLDMEADLGIDSIKRVEILGTLRDSVPALNGSADSLVMDVLSRARTLGAIVDRVSEIAHKPPSKQPGHRMPEEPPSSTASPVRRMVLEAVPSPLVDGRSGLEPGGVVVLTDDGRGIAPRIASGLREAGHPVELAGPDSVDFASPSAVERWLERARESGPLAAIVHALPLRKTSEAGLDPAAWSSRIGSEVEGLFHLAKGAADDLERASRRGGGALVAASGMGGSFASVPSGADFFPGQGGVAGLVKTLAREWPEIRARVVDLDPREDVKLLAGILVEEVLSDDGWSEVGHARGRRVRLGAVASPLDRLSSPRIELAPGEPVVVTGGARGITATLTSELARRWRPTLLLLGRSPRPGDREDPETARLTSAVELKAVLHARLRREGSSVTPADLERAYQSTIRSREIRANLEMFRSAGATVDYVPVDVRDPVALGAVLDGWRRRFGEPVGLVHGAGVIQDRLIRDKTPGSFGHVLGTKLDGALNLARLLRPDSIRFAALFSSIAGRFGNLGQSDYAAANEILSKLAIWLDRRWPGRVVSMIWGPWSGVGMVSDLEGHLGNQGLGMIPPEIGRSLLVDELIHGRKGDVEVIASGDLGTLERPIGRLADAGAAR